MGSDTGWLLGFSEDVPRGTHIAPTSIILSFWAFSIFLKRSVRRPMVANGLCLLFRIAPFRWKYLTGDGLRSDVRLSESSHLTEAPYWRGVMYWAGSYG